MKKFLLAVVLAALSICPLSGQSTTGYHRLSQVIARAPQGVAANVVPYATVSVTSTTTGLAATIYSDPLLTALISPPVVHADASGNYSYYIPLSYCVTESVSFPGQGIQNMPNICSGGSGGGGTLSVDGTVVSSPNLDSTTPTADAGYTLGTWKHSGSNISVEVPTSGGSDTLPFCQGSGGSGPWTCTLAPTTTVTPGMLIALQAPAYNLVDQTLNVNGGGSRNIQNSDLSTLTAGEMVPGTTVLLYLSRYGLSWVIAGTVPANPVTGGGSTGLLAGANVVFTFDSQGFDDSLNTEGATTTVTAVSISSSGVATLTGTNTLTAGQWIDGSGISSPNINGCGTLGYYGTGNKIYQVLSTGLSGSQFEIQTLCTTSTGSGGTVEDATYFLPVQTAAKPAFSGINSWSVRNGVDVASIYGGYTGLVCEQATNFAAMFGDLFPSVTGKPLILLSGAGINDIYSGDSAGTVEGCFQSFWSQAHAVGAVIVQNMIGSHPGSWGTNTDLVTKAVNDWLILQGKSTTNAASGQYWDYTGVDVRPYGEIGSPLAAGLPARYSLAWNAALETPGTSGFTQFACNGYTDCVTLDGSGQSISGTIYLQQPFIVNSDPRLQFNNEYGYQLIHMTAYDANPGELLFGYGGDTNGVLVFAGAIGPSTAPTGSCGTGVATGFTGEWVHSQDAKITYCNGTNWVDKTPSGGGTGFNGGAGTSFQDALEIAAPSNPASTYDRLYLDSTAHQLKCLTSSGGSCMPSGGGTSPLSVKGDLYGYNTTDARIPVGADGQVLTADSTQTLGVKWSTLLSSEVIVASWNGPSGTLQDDDGGGSAYQSGSISWGTTITGAYQVICGTTGWPTSLPVWGKALDWTVVGTPVSSTQFNYGVASRFNDSIGSTLPSVTCIAVQPGATGGGGGGSSFSPFPATQTEPLSTNFTPSLVSGSVVYDKTNRMVVTQAPSSSTMSLLVSNSSLPTTPYTIDLSGAMSGNYTSNIEFLALVLRDSTSGHLDVLEARANSNNPTYILGEEWTSSASYWEALFSNAFAGFGTGYVALRITDDGSTRKYYWSANGLDYYLSYSEATGTYITPDTVGLGFFISGSANGTFTVYNFAVTGSILPQFAN